MKVEQKQTRHFYLIYIRQYVYCLNEYASVFEYSAPIENNQYFTIVETKDNENFKDVIYKGRKYKKDLSVCFSGFREIAYIREIDNFNSNITNKEKLNYIRDYISHNKNEIMSEIKKSENKTMVKKGVN